MCPWLILMPLLFFAGIEVLQGQAAQELDHLEPIPPYEDREYGQTVWRALIKERPLELSSELWMIVRPSFSAEYAIVLQSVWSDSRPRQVIRFQLRWVEAKEAVWHWQTLPDGQTMALDLRKYPEINEITVDFPFEAGKEISKAWAHVVRHTRYRSAANLVLQFDGETYEFYVKPNLFGPTWSPKSGPPAMLVTLGAKLIAYVKAPPAERPSLLEECLRKAGEIQSYKYK